MKILKFCLPLLAAGFILTAQKAIALQGDSPVTIKGFATAAAVSTNEEYINYLNTNDEWRFDSSSTIGIQLKFPVSSKINFTTQLIAKGVEDFNTEMEWAYATISLTNNTSLRAGRLRIPFFRISDFLDVGYSYPWVRPPIEVYGQLGFSRFDGVDSIITLPVGDADLTIQPFLGSTSPKQDFPGQNGIETGVLDVTSLIGVNMTLSFDWIALRFGHTQGNFDIIGIDSLDGFLSMVEGAGYSNVADAFGITDRTGKFTGLGVDINYNNLRILSEFTQRETDGLIADTTGWYTMVAYRIKKVMPHITVSNLETDENYDPILGSIDQVADPAVFGATAQFVAGNTVNHQSITMGLRWDFMPRAAMKVEWQSIEVDDGSLPISPPFSVGGGYTPGDEIDLYSIALDVIF